MKFFRTVNDGQNVFMAYCQNTSTAIFYIIVTTDNTHANQKTPLMSRKLE